jgi:quinol monooxygenase YgiN
MLASITQPRIEEQDMANDTVRFTVDFTIDEGKVDAFEGIARAMSASTQKEPGTLAYSWYLSGDRKRCRLIEAYIDGNAVIAHLTSPVVKDLVPKLLGASKLSGFEVYGDPGPKAAEMLTGLGAEIFKPWHGFSR